jgi:hypothetical protein
MMRKPFRLSALAPLVLCLSAAAAAQQAAPPAPSNLILQVTYFEGAQTAFQLVPRGPEMVGAWFGHFKVIPRPAGAKQTAPVQAVNVVSRVEGEGVLIKVSVFTGERMFDREEPAGTYTAAVGEEVVTDGLEQFGVAPFRITVRRMTPNPAAPPVIVNKTQSVEAAITAFDSSKGVSARLSLRNLSAKRVAAVEYSETREGRVIWTRFAAEKEGQMLIEPGGVYSYGISQVRRGQISPDGFYVPHAPETIVVTTAVFEDGAFEGEPWAAARVAAINEGERAQLARALPLLRKASAGPGAAARLKQQVAALPYDADERAVAAILKRYPGAEPQRELVKSSVEVAMHNIRKELLDELTALGAEPDAAKLADWLKARREQLAAWLDRLPPAKSAAR